MIDLELHGTPDTLSGRSVGDYLEVHGDATSLILPRRSISQSTIRLFAWQISMDGYESVSGFLCPRCGQPIRCRVCGAIVDCLCGYPHKSVRSRRYRYARLTVNEEG